MKAIKFAILTLLLPALVSAETYTLKSGVTDWSSVDSYTVGGEPATTLPGADAFASVVSSKTPCQDIGDVLRASVAKGEIAGVVSAVSRPDNTIRIDCAGYADVERKIPMRPDTMFAMFSSSKSVCGTAVMILVGEGKIALDDPASKYLPEFVRIAGAAISASRFAGQVPPSFW